jgi:hypothetical protein
LNTFAASDPRKKQNLVVLVRHDLLATSILIILP